MRRINHSTIFFNYLYETACDVVYFYTIQLDLATAIDNQMIGYRTWVGLGNVGSGRVLRLGELFLPNPKPEFNNSTLNS